MFRGRRVACAVAGWFMDFLALWFGWWEVWWLRSGVTVGVVWVLDVFVSGLGYVVCFWVPVSRGVGVT